MLPEVYQKQFVEFIKKLYPEGIPDNVNCISLSDSFRNINFKFYFDKNDCFLEERIIIDTKKMRKPLETRFDESLDEGDISWLKEIAISISDITLCKNKL